MTAYHTAELIGDRIWLIHGLANDLMYLVAGTERALLIDTGMGFGDLAGFVKSLTALPVTVVNTHGHPDHAGGNPGFEEVWLHPADIELLPKMCSDAYRLNDIKIFYGETHPDYQFICDGIVHFQPTRLNPLQPDQVFDLGDRQLRVLEVPGHTPGCIGLLNSREKQLFIGDSIVAGHAWLYLDHSLPLATYLDSLKKLQQIENEFDFIFPGHLPTPLEKVVLHDLITCAQEIIHQPEMGEPITTFAGSGLLWSHGAGHIIYNPNNME